MVTDLVKYSTIFIFEMLTAIVTLVIFHVLRFFFLMGFFSVTG